MNTNTFPGRTGSSNQPSGMANTENFEATPGAGFDPVTDDASVQDIDTLSMADSPGSATFMGDDTTPSASSASTGSGSAAPQASGSASAARWTSMAHDTVDKVADFASRYTRSPKQAVEASKTLMQDKPVVAVGAALALGLLLGRLILR